MSRYRAPLPPSAPYITADGHARLKAEYLQLWHERRPEVVRALAAAAAEGDRSENAEYIYRKKELREIDRRVRYLQLRLPALQVVSSAPSDTSRVFFGATVTVYNESSEREQRYRIVGADEVDDTEGGISVDSPLARALIKRQVGDCVMVQLPRGETVLEVLAVDYSAAA